MALLNAEKSIKKKSEFIGYTGTSIAGGAFDEEYLTNWDMITAIDTYDKMRRSDSQIKMVLSAIKNPIKSAIFTHVQDENNDKSEEITDYLNWNWFENPLFDFDQWLSELLTYLEFGFSIHEKKFSVYEHSDFGLVHVISGMGFRKQSTIQEWDIKGNQGLQGVRQITYGDTVNDNRTSDVYIPVEKLCIFVNEREGDLWEGISILRPCYGPWFRKNLYLKLNAIGIEKAAIGTPIGTYPRGMETSDDKTEFTNILKNFAVHQSSYILKPSGFDVDVIKIDFDSDKIMSAIKYEDIQMSKSILFQFLELGTSGSTGSFALGADLSDIALSALQYVGDGICKKIDSINRNLVRWNFGDVDYIPYAKCSGINQKSGKELSEVVKMFADAGIIRPDDRLEAEIRERYNLPNAETTREQDELKRSKQAPDVTTPTIPEPEVKPSDETPDEVENDETKVIENAKLAESSNGFWRELTEYEKSINFTEINQDFETEKDKLHRMMKIDLAKLSDRAIRGVESLLKRNKDDKAKAALSFDLNGKSYEVDLAKQYARIVGVGAKQAESDLKIKLSELYTLAETDPLKYLPEHVIAALKLQARYQAGVHVQEIERIVAAGIMTGVEQQMDEAQILAGINVELNEYVESGVIANAAGTAVSININRGRDGWFFNPSNIKQIQAFQYSAILDTRTTDICLSLDGKISKPNDRDLIGLRPPNHHNCRSILVPITINEKKPEITGMFIDPDNPSLKKRYKDEGKPKPNMQKIQKSRTL